MSKYSRKILRDKFGADILDFKNDVAERIFAFTINIEKKPSEHFAFGTKEYRMLNYYNNIKTLSCKATIVIGYNKIENNNISPCIKLELRNSCFRQIFDKFIWKAE